MPVRLQDFAVRISDLELSVPDCIYRVNGRCSALKGVDNDRGEAYTLAMCDTCLCTFHLGCYKAHTGEDVPQSVSEVLLLSGSGIS